MTDLRAAARILPPPALAPEKDLTVTRSQSSVTMLPLPHPSPDHMPKHFSSVALLLLLCLPGAFAWGASNSNKPGIIVAQPADLSGSGADFSRDYSLGAKIYFDQINAQGGINGKRITYRLKDTAGSTSQGQAVARSLIDGGAQILFGVQGDALIEALGRDVQGKFASLPMFAAIGRHPANAGGSSAIVHLRATRSEEAGAIFKQLSGIGVVNFGVIASDVLSNDALQQLQSVAGNNGAKITAIGRLDANRPDGAANSANAMVKARPQAIIVIADTLSAAQVFRHYRQLDPGAFLCAPSEVNVKTLISIMGAKAARGLIVSQVVPNPAGISELAREHRKLMEKYADEPASPATLEGFIAARALVKTLQQRESGDTDSWQPRGKIDLGGYTLDFTQSGNASHFVELTVINREGKLLR